MGASGCMMVSQARGTSTFKMAFLLIFLDVLFWPSVATTAAVNRGTSGWETAIRFPEPWIVVGACMSRWVKGSVSSSSESLSSTDRYVCREGVYGGGSGRAWTGMLGPGLLLVVVEVVDMFSS